jgi:HK97 family phage portal protein
LFYQYQKNGETYDSEDVLHFKLMTQDGIVGLSPIEQCKNAIGWGMAVEEYGNTFFKNGAKLSGVLQTDRALSEQAIDRLRNSFNSTYSKLSGSNQTAVLEEGLQFKPVAISAEQAQFLASRTFSVEEVARIFNLPPHMLKDLSKSSFNNIEMQSQEFVTYTLMPYLTRIEEEMNLKLFRKTERGKKFIEFSAMGLLRGNIKDRTDYYRTMLNIGAMSINEIRRKENMNSIEEGDNHFMQLNMTTLNNIGNASE